MQGAEFRFDIDTASASEIGTHLAVCDPAFVPPLSKRVDLTAYALKIVLHARRFEAWHGDELAGLVAAYFPVDNDTSYVTNVSVLPRYAGRGVARELMTRCIDEAREADFARVCLEVNAANVAAIGLYHRLGFVNSSETSASLNLHLDLRDK